MTYNEVLNKVHNIVCDELEENNISVTANLLEDLAADSLNVLAIWAELDSQFNINTTDEEAETLWQYGPSVVDLAKFVCKKKGISVLQQQNASASVVANTELPKQPTDKMFENIDKTLTKIQQDYIAREKILNKRIRCIR